MSDTPSNNDYATRVGTAFPWHELYVADVPAAIKFYAEALGLGHEEMDMGEMGSYPMITHNGKPVAGIMGTTTLSHPVPPHWAVYLAVDDVDARVAKVLELGGTVVVEALNVPTVGRMALIADPQGAHLWLFQEEKRA
jgi:predicted enzyme related to lactoylglutathione lyase